MMHGVYYFEPKGPQQDIDDLIFMDQTDPYISQR